MSMLTYHNDPALKQQVLDQLAEHARLDQIVQGTYWADGKGCAVGCLTHDPTGGHHLYEELWGIPEWVARLEDTVFEGLPVEEAKLWPARLMGAIPVGVEITDKVADRLTVLRIDAELIPLAETWPESVRGEVLAAVVGVRDVLRDAGDREAARSAAESAAWSAARSAESAWSAESAARSAWWSARSAWSAESAARSAAWGREADRVITMFTSLRDDQ